MSPVLEITKASKHFGDGRTRVEALRGVSLRIEAGELVAIMGQSGSGKSTLLTIAGGLDVPSQGQVLIGGTDISTLTKNQRAALRRSAVGFVFQDLNLLGGLTALENVAMPLELDGVKTKVARAEAQVAIEQMGLSDRLDHFPDDLSGGERQRVAIARAMVGNRKLVLADEPTGALDTANGEQVIRQLRGVTAGGAGVLMVTHDAHLAAWADRVVFIRDGVIVSESKPETPDALLENAGV